MRAVITKSIDATALQGARVAFTGRLASMTRDEAQAIVRAAGGTPATSVSGRTDYLVIGMHGWPLRADGRVSAKLQRAETFRARGGPIRIVSESRFLEQVGLREREPEVRKHYPLTQVAELVDVEPKIIERWEYLGLVRSEDGAYDFQDIVSLRTIASLVARGVAPQNIRRSLDALASFLPETDRPLAQLTIVVSDIVPDSASSAGNLLAQFDDALVAPDGQQLIDFTPAPVTRTEPIAVPDAAQEMSVDDLLERAIWLEDEERYEDAATVYHRAIGAAPERAELYFNLGNVRRMQEYDEAAETLYRIALSIDPGNELAWYNLADIQEDAEEYVDAVVSLRRAVDLSPAFADAHFNLASCLEQAGDARSAEAHWRTYLQLDPRSEWADIARHHLSHP